MKHTKENMLFTDYNWNASTKQIKAGKILNSDAKFDRMQGEEVLGIINAFAQSWGCQAFNTSRYQKLEKIIRDHIPLHATSYRRAKKWLEMLEIGLIS